jgi:hypothetical protein
LPIAYNALFTALSRSFDYPDILRRSTVEILDRFASGGSKLILTWWAFAMSAVLLAPTAVLVSATFDDADPTLLSMAVALGLLAALVQFLGLIRWPFAVPHLAREMAASREGSGKRDAVDVTFQTLNRYLGVAVGEHLGYLFTGLWTGVVGVILVQSDLVHPAFGFVGLCLAPLFVVGSLEFVGPNEEAGWRLAGSIVPLAYVGWSLWLLVLGVALLIPSS